jgi:hypothetical protein
MNFHNNIYIALSINIRNGDTQFMSGYMGLMMGCSRPYWLGILSKINSLQMQTGGRWSWNDVRTTFPEITNSDMRRLNCSNWFVAMGKGGKRVGNNAKTSMWALNQDAIRLLQNENEKKSGGSKKKRN